MIVNLVLLVWFLGSSVFLFGVEAFTAAKGIPTISERLQKAGRSAPILVIVVVWLAGALIDHFFGH